MNSSSPEKEMIWSSFDWISRLFMPRIVPWRKIFSMPVRSGWKPAVTSIKAERRPFTIMRPLVGFMIRLSIFRSENRAVEKDILHAGEVRVEARCDLDQSRKTAVHNHAALGGLHDSAQYLPI